MTQDLPADIYRQWKKLKHQLKVWDKAYYQKNTSMVSDYHYDKVRKAIEHWETLYPSLSQPTVGYDPDQAFEKISHLSPLLSLDNAYTWQDMVQFFTKIDSVSSRARYVVEPKIDGVSVTLRYTAGYLTHGATRGNGQEGENILSNLHTLKDIPLKLSGSGYPDVLEIRGEVFMKRSVFHALNQDREANNYAKFSHPRNAAAGSLRQLDMTITAQRSLNFFAHGFFCPGVWKDSYTACMQDICAWGVPVVPRKSLDIWTQGQEVYTHFQDTRYDQDYEQDGLVYKIDDLALQKTLGHTGKYPKYALAYKFYAQRAYTHIQSIVPHVGRTGVVTPVALFDPVEVGGVTIRKASLYNKKEIARHNIHYGDKICIQRAGDVIPKIVSSTRSPHSAPTPYVYPTQCPSCHTPLRDEGIYMRCTFALCQAQHLRMLEHFVSKQALNIEGLARKHLLFFYEKNMICHPVDIFSLKHHTSTLVTCPGWGEKSLHHLLTSIEQARTVPLHIFIYSLGIPQVGMKMAKDFAQTFGTVHTWLTQIEQKTLEETSIPGLGPKTLRALYETFDQTVFFQHVQALLKVLTIKDAIVPPEQPKDPKHLVFHNKIFVLTGTMPQYPRAEMVKIIEQYQGSIRTDVTTKTHVLVVGDNPSASKLKKAKEHAVTLWTQDEWEAQIQP